MHGDRPDQLAVSIQVTMAASSLRRDGGMDRLKPHLKEPFQLSEPFGLKGGHSCSGLRATIHILSLVGNRYVGPNTSTSSPASWTKRRKVAGVK